MQKLGSEILYSPSDLINFLGDKFSSWMDRLYLERPEGLSPDAESESTAIIKKHGIRHELNFLETLKNDGKKICTIESGNRAQAQKDTLKAINEGEEIIYQAYLSLNNFAGYADFLVRVDGESKLGKHYYEVWDSKLASKAKPYFLVQLSCYAEILETIQGKLPEHVAVVLGNMECKRFRLFDYYSYYKFVKQQFLDFQQEFDPDCPPELTQLWQYSRWQEHAQELMEKRRDLSLIAGIRQSQIRRLKDAGISSLDELISSNKKSIYGISDPGYAALKAQARLQLASAESQRPCFEIIKSAEEENGLSRLPASDSADVFFDMEGYPLINGGLEYLFGACVVAPSGYDFHDWWAHDRLQEKAAFSSFMNWLYERYNKNPSMHVYHYGAYEISALRRLASRHAVCERELDELLRAEVFIDLYAIVRHSLRLGCQSYSLKNVECLYMEKRAGDVSKAVDSIVFYERWLEECDGASWQDSKLLAEIRNYNKLDCRSTALLVDWLRLQQEQNGIKFQDSRLTTERAIVKDLSSNEELAAQVLESLNSEAPADNSSFSSVAEARRIKELFAHLLCFHQREAKVSWWQFFDRISMSEDELYADPNCIAFARLSKLPAETTGRGSILHKYTFETAQDLKLKVGDNVCCSLDLADKAQISKLDHENGVVELKFSPKSNQAPAEANWYLVEINRSEVLEAALAAQARKLLDRKPLKNCVRDFLQRAYPNLQGQQAGAAIYREEDFDLDVLVDILRRLKKSYICIQGPPGTGKTYFAARAILELIKSGKRVAVSSNSHKAIENLLHELGDAALLSGDRIKAGKIGNDQSGHGLIFKNPDICVFKTLPKDGDVIDSMQVLGATAWTFARPELSGTFDYLFIDEAGQVSLANMIAMSECASNLVLIGDQLQLEQPIKGSHPGESGNSVLEYLLAGQSTISTDRGIFLASSRRMHPELCRLVSSAVYQGRLHSDPVCSKREITLASTPKLLHKTKGLLYLPVKHSGNSQSSREEISVLESLINELLGCKFSDENSESSRPLTIKDILVLSPFNQQVRLINSRIKGVRAGSVDLFQGQEAPVAIVSMCASDLSSSPRGMEFLLSKKRLNVAISRAQVLAIVLANPSLVEFSAGTIEQAELLNFFCRIMEEGLDKNKDSSCIMSQV